MKRLAVASTTRWYTPFWGGSAIVTIWSTDAVLISCNPDRRIDANAALDHQYFWEVRRLSRRDTRAMQSKSHLKSEIS